MTSITSGTSTERIIRSLLLSILVDVFAVLYLYDGYVGYPQKNAEELARLLGLPASSAPAPSDQLSTERGRKIAETVRVGEPLEKLSTEFGAPGIRQADIAYFMGPGGWLKVELDQDRVRTAKWFDAPHTESDQAIQRMIGFVLVVVGFGATLNLARVIATRAQLSDAGLQVTGRPLVPFEAMTGLRSSNSTKGVYELDYTHDGQAKTLRLDPYFFKNASAIAQVIADRKGITIAASR